MYPTDSHAWTQAALGSLFQLDTTSCSPASNPTGLFIHHSIPAWDTDGGPVIEPGASIGSSKFLITKPSVLVSKLNPRKPRVTVVQHIDEELPQCASTEFMVYVPLSKDTSIDFYGRYFASDCFQNHLEQVATGTTNSHVRVRPPETLSWKVPVPPSIEQRRIADILDTADAAIQRSEALIAKLKRAKAGLLHDLLTRGVDEHGQLRDPVAHPEQFKDSVLGRIPVDWQILKLGDIVRRAGGVIQTGPFGSQLHAHEYVEEGVPVVMPQDMNDGEINAATTAKITEKRADSLARHRVQINDVLFARRGDLSRCAVVEPKEVSWICGTGCLLVRVAQQALSAQWLSAVYRFDASQRQIAARAVGSTMVNLNTGLLDQLVLATPRITEQQAIVDRLEAHDACIRAEEVYCEKLKLQKKGLMDDLLTGRVRVDAVEAGV